MTHFHRLYTRNLVKFYVLSVTILKKKRTTITKSRSRRVEVQICGRCGIFMIYHFCYFSYVKLVVKKSLKSMIFFFIKFNILSLTLGQHNWLYIKNIRKSIKVDILFINIICFTLIFVSSLDQGHGVYTQRGAGDNHSPHVSLFCRNLINRNLMKLRNLYMMEKNL